MAAILSKGRWVNRSPAHGVPHGMHRSHSHTQYWQIQCPIHIFYKLFAWKCIQLTASKAFDWWLWRYSCHWGQTKDHCLCRSWDGMFTKTKINGPKSMWSILVSPATQINEPILICPKIMCQSFAKLASHHQTATNQHLTAHWQSVLFYNHFNEHFPLDTDTWFSPNQKPLLIQIMKCHVHD